MADVTTDPMVTYARLEALVDPLPAADEHVMTALSAWCAAALPPGRGAYLERTGTFPSDEMASFAAARLARELVPEDQGGAFEWSRLTRICARLAAHDLDFALCLGGAVLGSLPVLIAGSTEHRASYFEPILRGAVGGLGLSEWHHGSDLLAGEMTATGLDASGESTSLELATQFCLRGAKSPINNGTAGACLVVLAATGARGEPSGQSLFLIERQARGLRPYPRYTPIGFRCMDLSGAIFEDVLVPRSAMVGAPGDGFSIVRRTLEISRSGVAAMSLGPIATALHLSMKHAQSRVLYGQSIDRLGGVQALLARSFARACAAIALGRRAARSIAHAPVSARAWSCAAKLVCPILLEEIVGECGTLLGARSLMEDLPFARLRRSAPVLAIFDGSSQLQFDELWRHVVAWRRAGSLTHDRATTVAKLLAAPAVVPFDPHRVDDGGLAEATPPALFAALAERSTPLAEIYGVLATAAERLADAAAGLRGAPQDARFSLSNGASNLYALAALAEAHLLADGTRAPILEAAFALFAIDRAPSIASSIAEIGDVHAAAAVMAFARNSRAARADAWDALVATFPK